MNEREWMRIAGQALQTLERIEKTISEPKNISAHRVAANRRISKAMDYIAKREMNDKVVIDANEAPMEVIDTLKYHVDVLKDIRKILTER